MADVGPAIFTLNASKHQDKGILQKGIDKTKEIAEEIKEGAKNMVTLGTPTAEASGIHMNKAEDRCIDKTFADRDEFTVDESGGGRQVSAM